MASSGERRRVGDRMDDGVAVVGAEGAEWPGAAAVGLAGSIVVAILVSDAE